MDKAGLFLTWTQLFVVLAVLVLFYVAELYFIWLRNKKNNTIMGSDLAGKLQQLEDEIAFLKIQLAGLSSVQSALNATQQPSDVSVSPDAQKDSSYSQAIQLAKNGSNANQLMSKCGLSLAEAELIVAIYRGVYKG
jgi:hypothetical protein